MIDIWEEVKKADKNLSSIQYEEFTIFKYDGGFVYQMESGYKDIVSTETAKAMSFEAFLSKLDAVINEEKADFGEITIFDRLKEVDANLDKALSGEQYEN